MSGHRRYVRGAGVGVVFLTFLVGRAHAWGPDGHKTVAAIAEKLIDGTAAADQVRAILGEIALQDAAVWADCAKGVQPEGNPPLFKYTGAGSYKECAPFESPEGEAEMVDFVKRNYDTCKPKPGEDVGHKQYHYSDISVAHDKYGSSYVGARPDDIEMAISAAVLVLQGKPAAGPFSIKSKREALLVLTHYVGDIHQPLHVGALYLDANGKPVNPDEGTFDPATDTRGGNELMVAGDHNLHSEWDAIPPSMHAYKINKAWIDEAERVPATDGLPAAWSTAWATDTQKRAQAAFKGMKCGAKSGKTWSATLPTGYAKTMKSIKKAQLTKGGARLAQLLKGLWPESVAVTRPAH